MAWPGKLDKDELAKEMFGEDAATVKARLAKLDSMEGTLKTTGETINKQNELIETLVKSVKDLKVTSPYDSNNSNPSIKETKNEVIDWGEDADGAFNQRVAPLTATVLDTRAAISKRTVKENLDAQYHDWHLFADEIDELSKTAGLNQRVSEDFWKNCYFVVKGKHHDEIVRDQNKKEGKFFLETAGSSVVLRGDENKNPVDQLTDKEKAMAAGLGVPLDVFAKNKTEMGIRN